MALIYLAEVSQVIAYSALLMAIGFAVARPRLGPSWRVGPGQAATAGVLLLLIFGIVQLNDILVAAGGLWRSFIVIVSIMIMTSAAQRIGLLDKIAHIVLCGPNLSLGQMFSRVFFLSALTSSVLNNDAMVLLLTPLALLHVQRVYPGQESVHRIFAFAVFAAVGVAPFVISNPMNMIVADFAGIHFNQYFKWMAPLSLIGWMITFIALRIIFRRTISLPLTAELPTQSRPKFTRTQMGMLALLGATILAYPITASIDGSLIWVAAMGGAISALFLCTSGSRKGLKSILVHGVAWNIIIFLSIPSHRGEASFVTH